MGNTTKTLPGTVPPLAGQFKARNVTISVAGNEAEVVMYCKRMRLQPRIVRYFETSGVHVFAVAIPYRDGERETCLIPFERVMDQLGAKCEVSCGETDMICPLLCTTDGYLGLCSICGEEHPVMGPFAGKDKFLVGFHGNGNPVEELLCGGTARPPKGEVRRNYDGT